MYSYSRPSSTQGGEIGNHNSTCSFLFLKLCFFNRMGSVLRTGGCRGQRDLLDEECHIMS